MKCRNCNNVIKKCPCRRNPNYVVKWLFENRNSKFSEQLSMADHLKTSPILPGFVHTSTYSCSVCKKKTTYLRT